MELPLVSHHWFISWSSHPASFCQPFQGTAPKNHEEFWVHATILFRTRCFFFIIIFLQFWCLCLVLASVIPSEQNCAPSKFRECRAWEHLDCSRCWKWRNSLSLLLFSSSPNRLSWEKKPPLVSWKTNPYFSQTLLNDYFMLCSFPCQNF